LLANNFFEKYFPRKGARNPFPTIPENALSLKMTPPPGVAEF